MAQIADVRMQSRIFTLLCGVVIVAALYFARGILLPFALAILLSFLLTPIVSRFERWRLGRIPSVVITVTIAFFGIGIVGYIMALQFYDLANKLPTYQSNIQAKLQTFQSDGKGVLDRVSKLFRDVEEDLSQEPPGATSPEESEDKDSVESALDKIDIATVLDELARAEKAIPVQIIDQISAREIAARVLGPVLAPLGTLLIVIVFVVFILIEREDLRNRFIYLVGARQMSATTQAIDDAAYRVSRYLLMQLVINSVYGLVIAIGLYLIGLPNALMWGFLATLLRFIPYVGPWIAAIMPVAVSLAVFPGWTQPLLVVGLFVLNELVSNNVLEPWLYGSSTGISTIGVIISAVFWTWLWGPVGLVLAMPLTVCLTVIGRYVPQMSFINTLLSDDEVLPPPLHLYQRLLAMDSEEAYEVGEEFLKAHSLAELYGEVILPALRLAEIDRHHGNLEDAKGQFVWNAVGEMVEEFGAKPVLDNSQRKESAAASQPRVLCVPARNEADELAASMLAQLLATRGIEAQVMSIKSLASEAIEKVREFAPDVVCISALPPGALTHARYLAKRLRTSFPELKVLVGLWQEDGHSKKSEDRLLATGIDHLYSDFVTAAEDIGRMTCSISAKRRSVDKEHEDG